jgi:hypothetical protein
MADYPGTGAPGPVMRPPAVVEVSGTTPEFRAGRNKALDLAECSGVVCGGVEGE